MRENHVAARLYVCLGVDWIIGWSAWCHLIRERGVRERPGEDAGFPLDTLHTLAQIYASVAISMKDSAKTMRPVISLGLVEAVPCPGDTAR